MKAFLFTFGFSFVVIALLVLFIRAISIVFERIEEEEEFRRELSDD